jgi:DNA-binding transcriptional LysR family regulator
MKLNFTRLTLLRELQILGSITSVAHAHGLTRSAVSQQLSLLEQELGEPLFVRSSKGVELNEFGKMLAKRAESLIEEMTRIETELSSRHDEFSGTLRIAAFGTIAFKLLPRLVAELEAEHPNLAIHFQELEPEEGLQGLRSKSYDLAIVDDIRGHPSMSGAAIDLWPLCKDRMMALLNSDHPLVQGKRDYVPLSSLKDAHWALNVSAGDYQSFVNDACRRAGFTPKVVRACRNMMLTAEFVRHGQAVTVLPELAIDTLVDMHGITALPIYPEVKREIFCAIPRGTDARPALRLLIKRMRQLSS